MADDHRELGLRLGRLPNFAKDLIVTCLHIRLPRLPQRGCHQIAAFVRLLSSKGKRLSADFLTEKHVALLHHLCKISSSQMEVMQPAVLTVLW